MNENIFILVVEDDDRDAWALQNAFHQAGISNPLRILVNSEQAIDYLSGTGMYHNRDDYPLPGVIFTDLHTPITDELEVVRWVKSYPALAEIPIIALTDSEAREILKEAYDAGANLAFCRPNEEEKLVEAVRLCCEHLLVS